MDLVWTHFGLSSRLLSRLAPGFLFSHQSAVALLHYGEVHAIEVLLHVPHSQTSNQHSIFEQIAQVAFHLALTYAYHFRQSGFRTPAITRLVAVDVALGAGLRQPLYGFQDQQLGASIT